MFDNLTERFSSTFKNLKGQGKLSEANIKDALQQVRIALLEADVALQVVTDFTDAVKSAALGKQVQKSLNPGQSFIKLVQAELTRTMGGAGEGLNLATNPPAIILLAGLQGAGKTTTVAKLGRMLQTTTKKKVGVVSVDIYRPAAIKQLQTLAHANELTFFPSNSNDKPITIAQNAIAASKKQFLDVLIVDTAGRLHIDAAMMTEIKQLHASINPIETLFVADSMTGQDAANTAKAFNDSLPLTGIILTKTDGDARGGAALSIRSITGKPIKFLGTGEKPDALEAFHPERIASRILGMGDMLSLIEDIEQTADKKKTAKLAKKVKKGKGFDFTDLKDQLQQMQKMGGVEAMLDKLPGTGNLAKSATAKINDRQLILQIAVINSMTPQERRYPDLIKGSRKKRIAAGSGQQILAVNQILKQHKMMQKMMKKFAKGGAANMMRGLQGNQQGNMHGRRM